MLNLEVKSTSFTQIYICLPVHAQMETKYIDCDVESFLFVKPCTCHHHFYPSSCSKPGCSRSWTFCTPCCTGILICPSVIAKACCQKCPTISHMHSSYHVMDYLGAHCISPLSFHIDRKSAAFSPVSRAELTMQCRDFMSKVLLVHPA